MLSAVRSFINRIFNGSSKPTKQEAEEPMRRWTPAELAATATRLERTPPERWETQDHHDVVDYLVQRYLPKSSDLTEGDWQERRQALHRKVDRNLAIRQTGGLPVPEYVRQNEETARIQVLLHHSYSMSLNDFCKVVLPALARFPFASGVLELASEHHKRLWQASADIDPNDPNGRYERSDAVDALHPVVHPAVLETASNLRRNYEALRRAQTANCPKVRVSVPTTCRCLHSLFNERTYEVDHLLAAFSDESTAAPMLPPAQTPCGYHESPRLCSVTLLAQLLSMRHPGDDPDFSDWLEANLSNHESAVPDWRAILEAKAVKPKGRGHP
ncbi:hypothetical protein [Achromobacter xylosoxidans]|uniref:hypothetical protein n=1 Tax=Alcaligenes xylosoxydans xylosoxydans TaxID=85698 RepID=UPI0010415333|nr:hypothetical protein [Achromobacter xylosoxidans]